MGGGAQVRSSRVSRLATRRARRPAWAVLDARARSAARAQRGAARAGARNAQRRNFPLRALWRRRGDRGRRSHRGEVRELRGRSPYLFQLRGVRPLGALRVPPRAAGTRLTEGSSESVRSVRAASAPGVRAGADPSERRRGRTGFVRRPLQTLTLRLRGARGRGRGVPPAARRTPGSSAKPRRRRCGRGR